MFRSALLKHRKYGVGLPENILDINQGKQPAMTGAKGDIGIEGSDTYSLTLSPLPEQDKMSGNSL